RGWASVENHNVVNRILLPITTGLRRLRRPRGHLSCSSSQLNAYQCQSRLLVDFLPQVRGRLDEDDLQGRPDVSLHQVAAARRAVGPADDDVGVDLRLAVLL